MVQAVERYAIAADRCSIAWVPMIKAGQSMAQAKIYAKQLRRFHASRIGMPCSDVE
jgi:hypothetical protein